MQRSQPLLGTFVSISLYSGNRDEANRAISTAFQEIQRVDRLISIHRPESELARLNAQAAAGPVVVSTELFTLIARSLEIAGATEGSFDPTIRPLADLWGFIWKEYRLPTDKELGAVLPKVDYRLVNLNVTNRAVHFLSPGVSIDFGGIGKGYAVDCAIETLRQAGVRSAMVRAGGDIRVIGAPPGEKFWTVQIEDPRKTGRRQQVQLRDAAISTSGNYENFFVIDDTRYSHILDPQTGLPVRGVAACSVIAPTSTQSDGFATAFFVYGPAKTMHAFGDRYAIQFTTVSGDGTLQQVNNDLFQARLLR